MNARFAALLFGLSICFSTSLVAAHDFWLQPSEFWIDPQAATSFTLQVGHGPFRQLSPIPARRITRFQAIDPGGAVLDLHEQLHLGEFRLGKPGAYILVLQTDNGAQTHLPSIRFNDYLKVEGLTPALEQRERLHRMDADGSERYSRCAKSIVQVGPSRAESPDAVVKPVGLPLEIVPEASPYDLPRSAALPVRVIYLGRPLPGALVKLTDLKNDASPFETQLTNRDGRASFTLPTSGMWLLNVIWTQALPSSEETDFETIFSSLSFGFPSAP